MTDFAAFFGEGLARKNQHQSKFHIFKMGTMQDVIVYEDE